MNNIFPIELINEDGTDIDYNYPENPLKEKWNKLYPSIPKPEYSQVCDGYSCMYCGRCPKGDNWEIPKEDKEVWDRYQKQIMEYHKLHNPDLYKILNNIYMERIKY